ncbi:MAG: nitrogen fixation protein FixH, partial [Ramlibacter sp.]
IAMRNPDPVLAEDYYRRGMEINQTLAKSRSLTPALHGRNHAATPATSP